MNRETHVIEHKVTDYLDHLLHRKEQPMTDTTTQPPASAADSPQLPFWSALHHNLAAFSARAGDFLPKLESIALNPKLDELVEAGLLATGQPAADAIFTGCINVLKAHANGNDDSLLEAAFDLVKTIAHRPAAPSAADPAPAQPRATFTPNATGAQPAAAPQVM